MYNIIHSFASDYDKKLKIHCKELGLLRVNVVSLKSKCTYSRNMSKLSEPVLE